MIKRFLKLYFPEENFPEELKIEDFYKKTKIKIKNYSYNRELEEIKSLDKSIRLIVEDFLGAEEDMEDKVIFLNLRFFKFYNFTSLLDYG